MATNVSMQLTLAFASANANVPEVERLTSRETRAEEHRRCVAAAVRRVSCFYFDESVISINCDVLPSS